MRIVVRQTVWDDVIHLKSLAYLQKLLLFRLPALDALVAVSLFYGDLDIVPILASPPNFASAPLMVQRPGASTHPIRMLLRCAYACSGDCACGRVPGSKIGVISLIVSPCTDDIMGSFGNIRAVARPTGILILKLMGGIAEAITLCAIGRTFK